MADRRCCDRDRTYHVTGYSNYNLNLSLTPPRKRCPWGWAPGYYEATGSYQSAYRKVLRQCLRGWYPLGLFDCTGDTVPRGWWNDDPYRWRRGDRECITTTTTTARTTPPREYDEKTKKDDIESTTKKDDVEPVTKKDDVEPVTKKDHVEPVTKREDVEQVTKKDDVEPVTNKDDVEPVTKKDDVEPVTKKD